MAARAGYRLQAPSAGTAVAAERTLFQKKLAVAAAERAMSRKTLSRYVLLWTEVALLVGLFSKLKLRQTSACAIKNCIIV